MRPNDWRNLGEDEIVEFDVHCKMNKSWANEFLSLLKRMQQNGEIGHSETIGFYSDGDGDFRPNFKCDYPFIIKNTTTVECSDIDVYDAG